LKKALANDQLIQRFPPTLPEIIKLLNPGLTKTQRKQLASQGKPAIRDLMMTVSAPFLR
jgi:hypothetical protein